MIGELFQGKSHLSLRYSDPSVQSETGGHITPPEYVYQPWQTFQGYLIMALGSYDQVDSKTLGTTET